uniref:G protein-coupled receptor n=1 Tax=Steinernema glaseri TaxID=37863 RepID=A0A1I7ZC82_9BILA
MTLAIIHKNDPSSAYTIKQFVHTRSFIALHSNVRRTLACHVFYIIVTNTFILIGNSIDLIRLSLYHPNACDYLLPFSLTFFVRETYMFGIFGVAMTFAMLSVERCVATYQQKYEYNRSRLLFLCLVVVKVLCAILIAYFFMGYNVIFSSRVVTFTAVTQENANRLAAFIYSILGCELICVLSYHVIFLLNMRDRNQIAVKRRRLEQITKKSLSEKYQIDETRRVLRMMLPVSWCHLALYTITYGGFWLYTKVASVPDTLQENVIMVAMVEIFGVIIFYPFVFSFFMWRHFVRPRSQRLTQITIEDTQDYFKQMNELFRSSPMK